MSLTDRRTSLKLAWGAAVLPFVPASEAFAADTSNAPAFAPHSEGMIYRRKLERQLPGGQESFVVARDFAVRFEPFGAGGFRVIGRQQAVFVDAPPNLGRLAELERQRVEQGIFPLLLDQYGLIVDGSATPPSTHVSDALANVRRRFVNYGDEVDVLLDALHNAGAQLTAELPRDLFAPTETSRSARHEIELPWGDRGEVLTQFEASLDPQTQLMRHAKRAVTTRMGGEERWSEERWELFSA